MGRPSKLTPKVQAAICDAIRQGVPREQAARLANVAPSTLRMWLQTGATEESGRFRRLLDAVERSEDELLRQASNVLYSLLSSDDPKVALSAAKFLLERRYPEDWSQRRDLRVAGADGGPVKAEISGPGGRPVPVAVEQRALFDDAQLSRMSDAEFVAAVQGIVAAVDSGHKLRAERLFTTSQIASMSPGRLAALGRALSAASVDA